MSENPPFYNETSPFGVDFRCKITNNFSYMQKKTTQKSFFLLYHYQIVVFLSPKGTINYYLAMTK